MPRRPLKRATELTDEFLRDPEYAAIFDAVANESIGETLRAARDSRDLSQSEVARRMGVSRSRISQIEGAEGTSLSLDVLHRYSKALDCHLDIKLRDHGTSEVLAEIFVTASNSAVEFKQDSIRALEPLTEPLQEPSPILDYEEWKRAA
jgi:transcriptional regulator with XRE-family HTH domain